MHNWCRCGYRPTPLYHGGLPYQIQDTGLLCSALLCGLYYVRKLDEGHPRAYNTDAQLCVCVCDGYRPVSSSSSWWKREEEIKKITKITKKKIKTGPFHPPLLSFRKTEASYHFTKSGWTYPELVFIFLNAADTYRYLFFFFLPGKQKNV